MGVEAMRPLLESRDVTKVMHDCREDSAALYHQHGIELQGLYDTQVAQGILDASAGRQPHQASFAETLQRNLGIANVPEFGEVKAAMLQHDSLWLKRPLKGSLVHYSLATIGYLLPLRAALRRAGVADQQCFEQSKKAVEYCFLNSNITSPADMAKIGTKLWAWVAARTERGLFFKLNGSRNGVATTTGALRRFADTEPGDVVLCCVSGVSINGEFIFLDRYDHDWDYFDHQKRPAPTPEVGDGREHRHIPSMFDDETRENIDPLLLRELPAGTGHNGYEHGMQIQKIMASLIDDVFLEALYC